MVNSHGFITASLSSLFSLYFPTPCAPAILHFLRFPEWTTFLRAYKCLHMLFPLWNISYFLLSLWCPLTYSCTSYKTGLTLLPGSPLDRLSLLAEYSSWSPSYLYKSTYYTALLLMICLFVSPTKTGSFMRRSRV